MGSPKSGRVPSEKYKRYREKRIVFYRECQDPPMQWSVIGGLFGIAAETTKRIYWKVKDEQEKKKV